MHKSDFRPVLTSGLFCEFPRVTRRKPIQKSPGASKSPPKDARYQIAPNAPVSRWLVCVCCASLVFEAEPSQYSQASTAHRAAVRFIHRCTALISREIDRCKAADHATHCCKRCSHAHRTPRNNLHSCERVTAVAPHRATLPKDAPGGPLERRNGADVRRRETLKSVRLEHTIRRWYKAALLLRRRRRRLSAARRSGTRH